MSQVMDDRANRLASMRAPNNSGFDLGALAQALAGGGRMPTTYGYGLTPEQVQNESRINMAAQQDQYNATMNAVSQAIAQDQQLFNQAMTAQQAVLDEKKFALSERVSQAEIALKNAQISRSAVDMANAKTQGLILEKELDALQGLESFAVPVKNPQAGQPILDAAGQEVGQQPDMIDMPVNAFRAAGGNINYLLGIAPGNQGTQTSKNNAAIAARFVQLGIPEEDAAVLSLSPLPAVFGKAPEYARKRLEATKSVAGTYRLGEVTGADGKTRPMTQEEYLRQQEWDYIQSNLAWLGLAPESVDILRGGFTSGRLNFDILGDGAGTSNPLNNTDEITNILVDYMLNQQTQ